MYTYASEEVGTYSYMRTIHISGKVLYSFHNTDLLQVTGSVSAGGSSGVASGEVTVDITKFNAEVKESAKFGSEEYDRKLGVTIDDDLNVILSDDATPDPIGFKGLKPITEAFVHRKLWVQLPESGQSYDSLKIAKKGEFLKKALAKYPSRTGATKGEEGRWYS